MQTTFDLLGMHKQYFHFSCVDGINYFCTQNLGLFCVIIRLFLYLFMNGKREKNYLNFVNETIFSKFSVYVISNLNVISSSRRDTVSDSNFRETVKKTIKLRAMFLQAITKLLSLSCLVKQYNFSNRRPHHELKIQYSFSITFPYFWNR